MSSILITSPEAPRFLNTLTPRCLILGGKIKLDPSKIIPDQSTYEQKGFGFINPSAGSGSVISAVDDSGYGGQIRFSFNENKVYVRLVSGNLYGQWREI